MSPAALEKRLVAFSAATCRAARRIGLDPASQHMSQQLIRSATAAAANYAESRGATSRRDFQHRLQVALKELRETHVWFRIQRAQADTNVLPAELENECDELIAILVKSVQTLKSSRSE